jgi:DEAD/DEAH box helicase domain-containing protein
MSLEPSRRRGRARPPARKRKPGARSAKASSSARPADGIAAPPSISDFIARIEADDRIGRDVRHHRSVPEQPASFAPISEPLPVALHAALGDLGIANPWSHQAEAINRCRTGEDVLTVTPTASGKSLVYLIPTLEAALERPGSRALYLFPYKALAQDQLGGIRELAEATARHGGLVPAEGTLPGSGRPVSAAIYDGDTPDSARRRIKADPPDILITNPDMLHLGILAHHDDWRPFFQNLDCIVIDELHVYRGIFGSHLHHILRRLQRVTSRYDRRPRIIASSATIANPGALGEGLTGRPLAVVDRNGAPRAEKHLMFVNPTASPYTVATHLFAMALDAGFRTIAFTKARTITELMHSWLLESAPRYRDRISAYRSGYLPEERRAIEGRLFSGELQGVISTSALELGVDIGGLDVCILVGYPGSIVSSWQRIGRVGREDRPSLTILIAMPDALDQYFMANPDQFMTRGYEEVVFDPANPVVARGHLVCAGAEIPLEEPRDRELYGDAVFPLVEELAAEGKLAQHAEERRWFTRRRRPQRDVSLRGTGNTYTIIDESADRVIGTIDGVRAFHETHTGAIYLHHARQFLVTNLLVDDHRVTARPVEVEYYTEVRGDKETEILEVLEERTAGVLQATLGRVKVTEWITGYEKRRLHGRDRLGLFPLELPPLMFETVGFWITLPEELRDAILEQEMHFMGGIHASEHAMIGLFPLLAICDRGDIGGISYTAHPQVGRPAIFIYDGHPGGIGLAARGFHSLELLLDRTAKLVADCPCDKGCPSCIQSPKCGNGNNPLDKEASSMVLETLIGQRALPRPARGKGPAGSNALDAARARGKALAAAAVARGTTRAIDPPQPSRPPVRAIDPRPASRRSIRAMGRGHEEVPRSAVRRRGSSEGAPAQEQTLFFDLETQKSAEEVGGWGKIRDMKLALAITYNDINGRFKTYLEKDVDKLLLDLAMADRVIGYNIDRFDLTVLEPYSDWDLSRIRTFDMLGDIYQRLGFRLKLADVSAATLGISKSATSR